MPDISQNAIAATNGTGNAIELTSASNTCTANITNNLSNRNKIINGAMTVSQRHGTSAVQLSASEQYFIDRWENDTGSSFDMKCDVSQSSEAPEGFANSMKFDCDGVSTPTGGHNGLITTFIEGQDLQDLKFGTSNAKAITLSFYAKSGSQNNGHVYGVFLGAYLNGSRNAQTKGFTVTSSWQRFTMTFAGTGTAQSTAINNDNNKGMQVAFSLAVGPDDDENYSTWTANGNLLGFTGQDNFFDHVDNELYITGVQLEVSDYATEFEHRSYADELLRCCRYYYRLTNTGSGTQGWAGPVSAYGSDVNVAAVPLPVPMRAKISALETSGTASDYSIFEAGVTTCNGVPTLRNSDVDRPLVGFTDAPAGVTAGRAGMLRMTNNAYLGFTAEL